MSSARSRRRLRAILWRLRFVSAAVCCALAALVAVHSLRPAPATSVPVVVAARALDAGTVLKGRDLRVARVPAQLAPHGAPASIADVAGRTTTVAVTAGLPLVDTLTSGGGTASSAPPGTVVAPVRLEPAVAVLLSPGDRVDLLVADASATGPGSGAEVYDDDGAGSGAAVATEVHDDDGVGSGSGAADGAGSGSGARPDLYLARSALVVPTPQTCRTDSTGTVDVSGVVLVAVSPREAELIAARAGWEEVNAVLVP